MAELRGEIMGINCRSQLNLLHAISGPATVGFFRPLCFLIEDFAILAKLADRRDRGGHDLDQVNAFFPRETKRLIQSHDAKLLFCFVKDSDFAGANLAVSSILWFTGKKRAAQSTLIGWDFTIQLWAENLQFFN